MIAPWRVVPVCAKGCGKTVVLSALDTVRDCPGLAFIVCHLKGANEALPVPYCTDD